MGKGRLIFSLKKNEVRGNNEICARVSRATWQRRIPRHLRSLIFFQRLILVLFLLSFHHYGGVLWRPRQHMAWPAEESIRTVSMALGQIFRFARNFHKNKNLNLKSLGRVEIWLCGFCLLLLLLLFSLMRRSPCCFAASRNGR